MMSDTKIWLGKEFMVEWIEGTVKAKVIADPCIDMNLESCSNDDYSST